MALKTSLIIDGDTSGGQKAVASLRDGVDGLSTSAKGAAAPVRDLSAGQVALAGSGRQLAIVQGALAPVIGNTSAQVRGMRGELAGMISVQSLAREGGELLAGTLAGALAGGIAGVVSGTIQLVAQLGAEAYAAHQARSATTALDAAQAALDKTQRSVAKSARQVAQENLGIAGNALKAAQETRGLLKAQLEQKIQAAATRTNAPGTRGEIASLGNGDPSGEVARLRGELALVDARIAAAAKNYNLASIPVFKSAVQGRLDPATAATNRYEDAVKRLDAQREKGQLTRAAYEAAYQRETERYNAVTTAAGAVVAATGRVAIAHSNGTAAIEKRSKANGALAASERDLTADLSGVIARYDPFRKAASDYADELERIARLEKAGVGGGGISAGQAGEYRTGAKDRYIRDLADASKLPDAEATRNAATGLKEVDQASREAADGQRQLLDAARGALDAIIVGGEKASDVVGGLARSLASASLEAAVFGTGPLASVLSGAIGSKANATKAGTGIAGGSADVLAKSIDKGMSGTLDRVFGTNGKFSTTLKNAGFGSAAASLTGGNSATGALGGAVGGAVASKLLSGALGSFAGPFGSIAGGILGGVVGKLLTKTKSGSATIGDTSTKAVTSGNSAAFQKVAGGLAGNVQDQIADIAKQLGGAVGSFAPVTIGKRGDDFRVNTTGGSTLKKSKNGVVDFDQDEAAATAYAVQLAIARGAVAGLSSQVSRALASSPDVNKGLQEALKVQELQSLLSGAVGEAERAFRDFEVTAKERVRIARDYGFDVVAIEKRNADDRLKIATDLAKSQTGSLQALLDEMNRGSLFEGSAVDRVAALDSAIAKARTDLDAGMEGAGDTLAKLLQDRLGALKDAYGTTGAYASGRTETADIARAAIAQANARITASQTKSDPALKDTNAALDENNDQNARIIDALGEHSASLQQQTAILNQLSRGGFNLGRLAGV